MTLGGLWSRFERALQRYGPLGIFPVVGRFVASRVKQAWRPSKGASDDFDARHGVDTAGRISLSDLSVQGEAAVWGNPCQSISEATFDAMMEACGVEPHRFTFVDFGSGKGRAVLLASHYPFRRIVGVELAPELHAIAQQNVGRYQDVRQVRRDIELVCQDACTVPLPTGPTLVFMYNPFEGPVMARVVQRIRDQADSSPQELVVAYANPRLAHLFDAVPALRRVASRADFAIWKTEAAEPPRA